MPIATIFTAPPWKTLWGRCKKYKRPLIRLALLLGLLGLYLAYMVKSQVGLTVVPKFLLGQWKAYALCLGGMALLLTGLSFAMVRLWRAMGHHVFLLLCIGLGCLYSLLLPPISVPDEMGHISTAYRYSNLLLGQPFAIEGEEYPLRQEDRNVLDFPQQYTFEHNIQALRGIFTPQQTMEQTTATVPDAGNVFLYIPQIVGTTLGRLLQLGGVQLLYLGRLCNLLFFSFGMYYTLRKMHTGKTLFALAALLPTCLQQAASFSYDATITLCGFYLTASFVRLMLEKTPLGRLDMVLLCISGSLLATAKYGVYIPLLFLLLFLPKECFTRGWTKLRFALVFGGVVATVFLAINIPNFLYVITTAGQAQPGGGGTNTVLAIVQTPLHLLSLFLNTLHLSGSNLFLDSFGGILGYFYKQVPTMYVVGFILLLFLASLPTNGRRLVMKKPVRFSILATCLLVFLVLCMASYSWTPQDAFIIQGLQGRYFLPFLPLLMLAFQNGGITIKAKTQAALLPIASVLQFFVVVNLLQSLLELAPST